MAGANAGVQILLHINGAGANVSARPRPLRSMHHSPALDATGRRDQRMACMPDIDLWNGSAAELRDRVLGLSETSAAGAGALTGRVE
jgi:hypothetical protein